MLINFKCPGSSSYKKGEDTVKDKGIWVTPIRPPTVGVNQSRLRITLCSSHNNSDINYLAKCINELVVQNKAV